MASLNLGNATHHQWWWASDEFAEASQVLGDGGKGELELGAAWTAQPEPTEAQNALQVCEQHLDLLAVAPRLGELLRPGECPSNVAGCFVHIAWHTTLWRSWTTTGFERAWATIVRARQIAASHRR